MSVKQETVVVCNACGARWVNEKDTHSVPPDPWVHVSLGGHWMNDFGEAVKGGDYAEGRLDACSPECAIAILEKAAERMRRVVARFSSATKVVP